jgi:hypothetical protein
MAKLQDFIIINDHHDDSINNDLLKTFNRRKIENIKKRELRRFKESQEKKWRNWLISMSK